MRNTISKTKKSRDALASKSNENNNFRGGYSQ